MEELTRVTADLRALHDFQKPKGPPGIRTLPDNWLPIPHKVEFPFPYVLDRLTPSSIGCAVVRLSDRDKKKEPFLSLDSISINEMCFQVDRLNRQQEEICAEIMPEIPSRSKATQKRIIADLTRQLEDYDREDLHHGQKRRRERKTKYGHPIDGVIVRAMEIYICCLGDRAFMNLNDLSPTEREKAVAIVAKELFPIDYADTDKRKAAVQRVRHYIQKAYDASVELIP